MIERTLSIIKPDATERKIVGEIITRFERSGLDIIAQRRLKLTRAQAEQFYGEHRDRPFFADLVNFMISGPVVVSVLEGENAILRNREIMGATDPKKAAEGSIRADFGVDIEKNSVHGSDASDTAAAELSFFFRGLEL